MVFSEYLSAAKGAITYVKGQVRYRGLNTGGGWIRDPPYVPQKSAARIKSLNMASENRAAMANTGAGWDQFVDQWIREALASQTGNCCELSAIAFRYLQRQGIRPVEFSPCIAAAGITRLWCSIATSPFRSATSRTGADSPSCATHCTTASATQDFCRRGIRACFRCVAVT